MKITPSLKRKKNQSLGWETHLLQSEHNPFQKPKTSPEGTLQGRRSMIQIILNGEINQETKRTKKGVSSANTV